MHPEAARPGGGSQGGDRTGKGGGEKGAAAAPPTWPAAVTVLLWPPGRPAGACPPGPSGPTPPRGGSRRSRLHFRSGTGAGRSRRPPSRRRPAGCRGRCSGRPRRRGSSEGSRRQRETPTPRPLRGRPRLPPCLPAGAGSPHLRQPVHVARACGPTDGGHAAQTRHRRPVPWIWSQPTLPGLCPRPRPLRRLSRRGPGRRVQKGSILEVGRPHGLVTGPSTQPQTLSLNLPGGLRSTAPTAARRTQVEKRETARGRRRLAKQPGGRTPTHPGIRSRGEVPSHS